MLNFHAFFDLRISDPTLEHYGKRMMNSVALVQPEGDKKECVRTKKGKLVVKVLVWVVSLFGH